MISKKIGTEDNYIEQLKTDDGCLYQETPYVNGKIHGEVKTYDTDNFRLVSIKYYVHGELIRRERFSRLF